MTSTERKQMICNAIKELKSRIDLLSGAHTDAGPADDHRCEEVRILCRHLDCAYGVLVLINEQELEVHSLMNYDA